MHWNWHSRQPRETDFEAIRNRRWSETLVKQGDFTVYINVFLNRNWTKLKFRCWMSANLWIRLKKKQPGLYSMIAFVDAPVLNCTKGFLYIDEVTPGKRDRT